ncbi:hypothetical protein ABZS66_19130 [Dactylosporangium sp. NPDC005572]|uniref:hypothetical protein n=1 Tax=Dactylosporangium sp. NPDC005572 TaxID=3156889 RepID=UPI0033BABBD7
MTDQPMQGSTDDYCSAFPGEPHHLVHSVQPNARISVSRCSLCGWINFADLREQALALIAEGRRQATEDRAGAYDRGVDRGFAVAVAALRDDERYTTWWSSTPESVRPTEPIRRHLADYLEVVGPWETDQPTPERPTVAEISAYELWRQAGGGTDAYDQAAYRQLMLDHGLLIALEPGETAEPLPCGWPHRRVAEGSDHRDT